MKNSFILYTEYSKHIGLLNMEQRGVLFTAIMNYELGEPLPEMEGIVEMAFSFIKDRLDKDDKTYQDKIHQCSEAGKKGGARVGNKNAKKQTETNENEGKQTKQADVCFDYEKQTETSESTKKQTKQALNVYVNEDVNEKEKEYLRTQKEKSDEEMEASPLSAEESSLSEQVGKKRKEFIPPSLEEVKAYAEERGYPDLAERFFDYFEAGAWHDSEGKSVKNWKQKFITWEKDGRKVTSNASGGEESAERQEEDDRWVWKVL